MAKLIKEVGRPHDCQAELKRDLGAFDVYPGSVAECSCLKQFVLRCDPRDGRRWAEVPTASDGWPYEPRPAAAGTGTPEVDHE